MSEIMYNSISEDKSMNRIKRIAALIGVFLLAFMYVLTLFAALFDDGKTMPFLKASIALTILVPTLIWVFGIFIRISRKDDTDNDKE
jgi:hypothetical protein